MGCATGFGRLLLVRGGEKLADLDSGGASRAAGLDAQSRQLQDVGGSVGLWRGVGSRRYGLLRDRTRQVQPACRIVVLDKGETDRHNRLQLVASFPAFPAQTKDDLPVQLIVTGNGLKIIGAFALGLTEVAESENIFACHRTFSDRQASFHPQAPHHSMLTTAMRLMLRFRSFSQHSVQTGLCSFSCSGSPAPERAASSTRCGGASTQLGCHIPASPLDQNGLLAGTLSRRETILNRSRISI